MEYFRDKIIVLQNTRHLESNLIVKGINSSGSILSFFAPFALKSKKRFLNGVLEPGSYIGVGYRPSQKPEGWNRLQQAWGINKFNRLRKDYNRLSLALYILKMFNKTCQEGNLNEPRMFQLLGHTLKTLETTSGIDQLKLFFEIRFLFLQGVLPSFLQSKEIFFQSSISENHKVDLEKENLPQIKESVQQALDSYLDNVRIY